MISELKFLSLPVALLPVVALVVAAAVFVLYRRSTRPVSKWAQGLLGIMRWTLLAVLVACLFEPAWTRTEPSQHKPLLAVMIDTSASMSLADGASGIARAEEAKNILEQVKDDLEDRSNSLEIRHYAFDDRARRVEPQDAFQPIGSRTALLDLSLIHI